MNDPFLNGKKEVIGMDLYQQYGWIMCTQKSECPVGHQSTETDFPSGNFFLKSTVILDDICKSACHTCRGGALTRSVYRSTREQRQHCEE